MCKVIARRKVCREDRKLIKCESGETLSFSSTVNNFRRQEDDQFLKHEGRICSFYGDAHWNSGSAYTQPQRIVVDELDGKHCASPNAIMWKIV